MGVAGVQLQPPRVAGHREGGGRGPCSVVVVCPFCGGRHRHVETNPSWWPDLGWKTAPCRRGNPDPGPRGYFVRGTHKPLPPEGMGEAMKAVEAAAGGLPTVCAFQGGRFVMVPPPGWWDEHQTALAETPSGFLEAVRVGVLGSAVEAHRAPAGRLLRFYSADFPTVWVWCETAADYLECMTTRGAAWLQLTGPG